MFNIEEEIKAWNYLLDTGEIDEITYNQEINKLKLKDEKRKNHRKVTWSSDGNRYLSWYSSDGMWINEMGGVNKITEFCSNNHLIPSDNKNKKLIDSIKEGDFIRIEGYLVNVYCKKSDGSYFNWNTSTSRNDTGNGACEIVYVTNITWLEQE